MTFNKKQILEIIQQEINWHISNKNQANMPEDWVKGFIDGLRQAKTILKAIK